MNKFTIFTIILAVSVVTVTVDLAVRDYFGAGSQASVLSAQPAVQPDQPVAEQPLQTQPQAGQPAATGEPSIQQYTPPSSSTT
ncbi:MAG: hypothetical protein AAB606_02720, partial [Patescibacteria group bacterium]